MSPRVRMQGSLRRALAALVAGAATVIGALAAGPGPTPALAWTDGNRYAMGFVFDHDTITYFIDPSTVPAWDDDNINNAADAWTAVDSKMYYLPGGTSTSTADVQIMGVTKDSGWSGVGGCNTTTSVCPSRSGSGYVKLYFDPDHTTAVNGGHASYSDTPTLDQGNAGHEQGHTFGLAHSCVVGSLMQGPNSQFSCGSYPTGCAEPDCTDTPQADDAAGDIALYGQIQPPVTTNCTSVAASAIGVQKLALAQWIEQAYAPSQIPLNAPDLYVHCPF